MDKPLFMLKSLDILDQYKKQIIIGICLLMVIILGLVGWQRHQKKLHTLYSDRLLVVISQLGQEDDEALQELENLVKDDQVPDSLKTLVEFKLSKELFSRGEIKRSNDLLLNIYYNSTNDDFIRDLARFNLINRLAVNGSINELEKFLSDTERYKMHNFKAQTAEQIIYAKFKAGKYEEVEQLLKSLLNDQTIPGGVANRMREFENIYHGLKGTVNSVVTEAQ